MLYISYLFLQMRVVGSSLCVRQILHFALKDVE